MARQTHEILALCQGIDIGRNLIPSTVNRIAYDESNAFDRQLSRSLRNRARTGDVVRVEFADGQLKRQEVELFRDVYQDSKRIMVWLDRIDETGGQVKVCALNPQGQLESFNLLTLILTAVLDMLNKWTLYQPAKQYHARVITASPAAEGPTPVVAIEFIRRSRVQGDLTCQWRRP